MLFSSMVFLWVFLPAVLLLCFIIRGRAQNLLLLTASLIFYAWGEPVYVLLMLFSILANWAAGLLIAAMGPYKGSSSAFPGRLILALSVLINLGLLGYYKYAGLLVLTANRLLGREVFPPAAIALPIGISFFTFQALSYVIDVYRGDVPAQRNIISLALYISFFPQLIAGPIVRYKDIESQIRDRKMSPDSLSRGITRFVTGLAKKVLIANVLAASCDAVYALPTPEISGVMALVASLMYSLQLYYDFSGYSDMAIGLGAMFGFEFRENFDYPYISRSISEFWRRWHISLGTWFREYLYIPLGGNRKGELRTLLNLGLVFFLTGLWHGAGYNFIFWGIYHGFFCIIERLGLSKLLERAKVPGLIYSLIVVNTGWIFFRIGSLRTAAALIFRMITLRPTGPSGYSILEFASPFTFFIFAIAVLGCGFIHGKGPVREWLRARENTPLHIIYISALMILSLAALAGNTYNPFIYFRF